MYCSEWENHEGLFQNSPHELIILYFWFSKRYAKQLSMCLMVLVVSQTIQRVGSFSDLFLLMNDNGSISLEVILSANDFPEPYEKQTESALHSWLLCRGIKAPTSWKKK